MERKRSSTVLSTVGDPSLANKKWKRFQVIQIPQQMAQPLEPLQIDCIVEKIFTFLNIEDLKSMRKVCKAWGGAGRNLLLDKCYLRTKLYATKKKEKEANASALMSLVGTSKMLRFSSDPPSMLKFLQKFPQLGSRIKELNYFSPLRTQIANLANILDKLPNLEILETRNLNLDPNQPYFRDDVDPLAINNADDNNNNNNNADGPDTAGPIVIKNDPEEDPRTKLEILLDKLESLKELRLNFPMTDQLFLGYVNGHHDKLRSISRLLLTKNKMNIPPQVQDFMATSFQWRLVELTWRPNKRMDKQFIRQLLLQVAGTLKFLDLKLYPHEREPIQPWTDDWFIPLDMVKLETLRIYEGSSQALVLALQLPALTTLAVTKFPTNLDTWLRDNMGLWNYHPLAHGRSLKSWGIREVQLLGQLPLSSSSLLNGSLWPKLTSLKVNALTSPLFKSSARFEFWRGLRRLHLDLTMLAESYFSPYHVWMTGVKCPIYYRSGQVLVGPAGQGPKTYLRDLDNLRCLTIQNAWRDNTGFLLGDFLIYNCFRFMTKLLTLHLYSGKFSEDAVEALNHALGNGQLDSCRVKIEDRYNYNNN